MKSVRYAIRYTWLLLLVAASTEAAEFQEGVHYQRLPVPVETKDASKVEVVEVFSYACIHCKNFDSTVEGWRVAQAEDVSFRRVPAIFNKSWALLAQAFYAAEILGVSEKVHQPIFRALHDQGVNLGNPELLAALFLEVGDVAPDDFSEVFNSFGVRSKVQQADAHGRAVSLKNCP